MAPPLTIGGLEGPPTSLPCSSPAPSHHTPPGTVSEDRGFLCVSIDQTHFHLPPAPDAELDAAQRGKAKPLCV